LPTSTAAIGGFSHKTTSSPVISELLLEDEAETEDEDEPDDVHISEAFAHSKEGLFTKSTLCVARAAHFLQASAQLLATIVLSINTELSDTSLQSALPLVQLPLLQHAVGSAQNCIGVPSFQELTKLTVLQFPLKHLQAN
jgi:hypothetical protein